RLGTRANAVRQQRADGGYGGRSPHEPAEDQDGTVRMQAALYVGLSAQVALERRLNTIAQNVANMSTAGYRAEEVKFETVLSRTAKDAVAFATSGENYISRRQGGITKTDNPLDLAIDGDAWFAIATPAGIVHS